MIAGIELDFVVGDSLQALALYQRIFDAEPLEVTQLPKGKNEAVFSNGSNLIRVGNALLTNLTKRNRFPIMEPIEIIAMTWSSK